MPTTYDRKPTTGLSRAPRAMTAQESVNQARQRMQEVGPGYTGSVWAAPGSYTAARPARPANTAPSAGAAAPVGTSANPAPNPTAPVRPSTGMTPIAPMAPAARPTPQPAFQAPGRMAPQTGILQRAPRPISPPPQTEGNNPLSGAETAQMEGTTRDLPSEMGFSQRGRMTPRGLDAMGDPTVGGQGLYARRFRSPQAATMYGDFTRRLFG
jgi:hypothetical protein